MCTLVTYSETGTNFNQGHICLLKHKNNYLKIFLFSE